MAHNNENLKRCRKEWVKDFTKTAKNGLKISNMRILIQQGFTKLITRQYSMEQDHKLECLLGKRKTG